MSWPLRSDAANRCMPEAARLTPAGTDPSLSSLAVLASAHQRAVPPTDTSYRLPPGDMYTVSGVRNAPLSDRTDDQLVEGA